jgi:hypothetical protein
MPKRLASARPFTACPNGRVSRGAPHEFVGFVPEEGEPMIFCSLCGEVRALRPAPVEQVPEPVEADGGVATVER